jgi:hypothetical protein
MPELRELLERADRAIAAVPHTGADIDRLRVRRERARRRDRIGAIGVAVFVCVVASLLVTGAFQRDATVPIGPPTSSRAPERTPAPPEAGHEEPWRARAGEVIGGGCVLEPNADCSGADLSYMVLSRNVEDFIPLAGIDLSGANLSGAQIVHVIMRGADLSGADLTDAEIVHSVLSGSDLHGADFTGARLAMVSVRTNDLEGAIGYRPE